MGFPSTVSPIGSAMLAYLSAKAPIRLESLTICLLGFGTSIATVLGFPLQVRQYVVQVYPNALQNLDF